jgi:hypothetical protein
MKLLRAVLAGILLWILIFMEISVVRIGLGMTDLLGTIGHYVLLIPLSIAGAWFYYSSEDDLNGFILGILMLFVGIVIDSTITVPLFQNGDFLAYFSDPLLWGGFLISVLTVGIFDLARRK